MRPQPAYDASIGCERDGPAPTTEEDADIVWARSVPDSLWFEIAKWAKATDTLATWQRSIAFSLGKPAAQGRAPSRKQAAQGKKIYDEAM